jgi:hypothetical protein
LCAAIYARQVRVTAIHNHKPPKIYKKKATMRSTAVNNQTALLFTVVERGVVGLFTAKRKIVHTVPAAAEYDQTPEHTPGHTTSIIINPRRYTKRKQQ